MCSIAPISPAKTWTTDEKVARGIFGGGGRMYTVNVWRGDVLKQTLPGAGESEYLVPTRVRAKRM